ncbi:hypothetical protein G3M48_004932 [Beauveria asiatica]|uniref:25S rRNA (uridine-N(3))-methyltransferase BMT5-like domain-containing protein n=1 Tax=Beauveria asiatica TaxID=1069075 RepID=A0AAW0RSZ3_9HYPO
MKGKKMGCKRRKLLLKQQANGKAKPTTRAFIPNRHSDKPLAAAGPSSGAHPSKQQQSQQQQQQSQTKKQNNNKKAEEQRQRQLQRNLDNPTIPFDPEDRILLVGEGDLSFAASLVRHHRCRHVTATVLEKNRAELVAKYPSAEANIAVFHGEKPPPPPPPDKTNDQDKNDQDKTNDQDKDAAADRDSPPDDDDDDDEATLPSSASPDTPDNGSDADDDDDDDTRRLPTTNKLLYNVDATKLPPSLASRSAPRFDRILFNFPHVGGKSTDVNRQVRYNQELLVGFFRSVLAGPLAPGGSSVVVTVFEGEPYTLWNVRDLARHVGLQADASFQFQAAAYPGYRHARTLGVVRSKKGGGGGGGGAWRGEEREARSFVFVRKGDVLRKPRAQQEQQQKAKKKRKRSGDDDDDDESSEDDMED